MVSTVSIHYLVSKERGGEQAKPLSLLSFALLSRKLLNLINFSA